MSGIFRKNCMANNLNRFKKWFSNEYNFYPKTWVLPGDLTDFKNQLKKKKKTFILKPEASSQGQGIYLARQVSDIQNVSNYIAQEYLKSPLLIDFLKFDFRIYVLVTGCDPLRIFIHEEGLARFATEEYKAPNKQNMDDIFVHLTNYSVNKNNPNFVQADKGSKSHKRSLSSVLIVSFNQDLSEKGVDVEMIWDNICDIVVKTILTIQPSLASTYKMCQPYDYSNDICFEILGFDIILDSDYKPWLLEVNHSPSFSTDSSLDLKIKTTVITDAIRLLNINSKKKKEFLAEKKKIIRQRSLSGKSLKPTKQENIIRKRKEQEFRNDYEEHNCGGYIKVYPGLNDGYYQQFIDTAQKDFHKLTTPKRYTHSSYSKIQDDEDTLRKNELSNISTCLANRRAAWS